jgi:hypothetical protein
MRFSRNVVGERRPPAVFCPKRDDFFEWSSSSKRLFCRASGRKTGSHFSWTRSADQVPAAGGGVK